MTTEDQQSHSKPLFRDIDAEDDDPEVMEMESLCVNCEKQGMTRLFLTRIPFFKEVIISSFACDHCGNKNTELQPGGKIQDKGVKYSVRIKNEKDLNRSVVQTNSATVQIPQLEFEAPPNKGVLTTVEGIIDRTADGLEQDQPARRDQYPEAAAQIDQFILKLKNLKTCETPFDLIVDDPSGNSYIENPHAPQRDPEMTIDHYVRTKEQDHKLGIFTAEELSEDPTSEIQKSDQDSEPFNPKEEVLSFFDNCPGCNAPCATHMKQVDIPHFKQVVIMATNCEACGHRDNEVKGGAGIEPKGTSIKLHLTDISDLTRDVLKSETSSVAIPELEFETDAGTLGGKFTTLEGLLVDIKDQLKSNNPFFHGDSSQPDVVHKLQSFCSKLDEIISGKRLDLHIILDDPAGNSYLQNVYAPDDDPEMEITQYERSWQQNEDLGLNDMKTENYETS